MKTNENYKNLLRKIMNISDYSQATTKESIISKQHNVKWDFKERELKMILPGYGIIDLSLKVDKDMFFISDKNDKNDYILTVAIPDDTESIQVKMEKGIFSAYFIKTSIKISYI